MRLESVWEAPQHYPRLRKLLMVAAWIYGFGFRIMRPWVLWHRRSLPDMPVLAIGNLRVGGTGKTPFVRYLVEKLQSEGLRPLVISRGYGRRRQHVQWVTPNASAHEVGDEPLMLVRQTGCAMVVGKDRFLAAQHALQDKCFDVILLDDGLHQSGLHPTWSWLIEHAEDKYASLLPLGPLRCTSAMLGPCDKTIQRLDQQPLLEHDASFCVVSSSKAYAYNDPEQSLSLSLLLADPHLRIVIGVARPKSILAQWGLSMEDARVLCIPDHGSFETERVRRHLLGATHLLVTAKDAMRLLPEDHSRAWVVDAHIIVSQALQKHVNAWIATLLPRSKHG